MTYSDTTTVRWIGIIKAMVTFIYNFTITAIHHITVMSHNLDIPIHRPCDSLFRTMFIVYGNNKSKGCIMNPLRVVQQRNNWITGVLIIYWTICSGANERKHQNSASLAFVRGIHQWITSELPAQSASNAAMFPFYNAIMWIIRRENKSLGCKMI